MPPGQAGPVAGFRSLSAAGKSIERLLNARFESDDPIAGRTVKAVLVRTDDFETGSTASVIKPPAISLFLYRVDFNKAMRAAWSSVGSQEGRPHLPLDLHFLLTPWADNAEHEQQILGRAMQCLEAMPVLSGPLLDPSGNWAPNEAIQVVLEDMTTEALMRTFDSLSADFRLSVPYIARPVRIDGDAIPPATVTTVLAGIAAGAS